MGGRWPLLPERSRFEPSMSSPARRTVPAKHRSAFLAGIVLASFISSINVFS